MVIVLCSMFTMISGMFTMIPGIFDIWCVMFIPTISSAVQLCERLCGSE